ncbi:Bifunctional protein folD (Includes: Methylenetetrahydrofolate dehydrogenase; Methenyltetrahydrofolate cyclohydrolase) [Mycoplasmoides gallisepticum str. F]|uniref:bifunctional 5,10-methylenetetrahydrofolate dehydrogenase/5,10-methenyltetrahydrofolate cyclohydrolase n=1 Tax=Mycoplasmoides gallisepticum TaxID=2096 RepID=UPI0001C39A60|nr:bifunctional 5,10-methylenetetrahydrofolate dehydrogenase/5,10-methenyltetrahydrofolate cyclohydrolase [Mycoplasmoides gallisepticum]ADC31691.1 Bifunctional protein folD (Includes: Methylenetetrahydrofolate dehydrogenase; Methenyltetrahydrofolate cyclohydrolase) [Mycoplasmoides gallisepticum str. F]
MFIKLDGTKLSQKLKEDLAKKVNNQKIKLLIIISDPSEASRIYVRNKISYCESLGIQTEVYDLSKIDDTNQFIVEMNQKISLSNPNGMLVQLPIKEKLDTNKIIENIPIDLDVDAFLYHRFDQDQKEKVIPCVLNAVLELFKEYQLSFLDKKILLIGNGITSNQPIVNYLNEHQIKFDLITKENSQLLEEKTKVADLVISAVGKAKFLANYQFKRGVIFIDIGIDKYFDPEQSKYLICGDFDYDKLKEIASYGTPTPGGIGPLTIYSLVKNLINLSEIQKVNK